MKKTTKITEDYSTQKAKHSESILTELLTEKSAIRASYGRRKEIYSFQSIDKAEFEEFQAEGWELSKEGPRKYRIKKEKSLHAQLEDQVWCLFYRLGYQELSGEKFHIEYLDSDGKVAHKLISTFAKDEETVVIAFCKSRETRGKKTLQKELSDIALIQRAIANAIKKHYGAAFRPKIIWMYVTQNIIWSEQDIEKADSANIRVVTENELQYFDAFARHMGAAGRFQFLAEFLEGQDIPELEGIKVPATKGKLGDHVFYSFVTTPRHLLKIAFVNHQALNHPAGRPTYQRMISPARIKEIGDFIRKGGYFPTNLLINFTDKCRFDLLPNKENALATIKFGWLHLPHKYKSAWIIDGQHRLYGYSHLEDRFLDQSVAVIAFEKMKTNIEAELFVTINQKQKSVQKSVIVSLQSDLKWGSHDPKERASALASRLAKTLSADATSPFFQLFSIQGVVAKDNQSLTIPELVNGLNRSGLLGKPSQKNWVSGVLSSSTDEKTVERSRRFFNLYFSAIREANKDRWDAAKQGYIATNPGIRAHLLLLAEVFKYLIEKGFSELELQTPEQLLEITNKYMTPVTQFLATSNEATLAEKFSRKFGEGGVREYADNLIELIHKQYSDFGSAEFLERLERKSGDRVKNANQDVIDLSQRMLDHVVATLKKTHGVGETPSGDKAYWEIGIESPKIKEDAYKRQLQDTAPNKGAKENYLQILDLKAIVRQKNNWPHFESTFNIPLPSEKGKIYYLDWMEKFNELRRIPAHPSSNRGYTNDDLEFLNFIKENFYSRFNLHGDV